MDRIILLIAALIVLYGSGCGDDLGYVEVPEADASVPADFCGEGTDFDEDGGECLPVDYEEDPVPADFCGDGTYFDEFEGECLPVYDDEEDPILPEPSPEEGEEPPPEEEEEEGEEEEEEEEPEEPLPCEDDEEPNWVYLKSTEDFSSDMIRGMTMGEGCTLPYVDPSGYPSSNKYIVVRIDGDADWSNFHYTGWYYGDNPITAISGWGEDCEGWCLEVNGVTYSAMDSTTNPCETD